MSRQSVVLETIHLQEVLNQQTVDVLKPLVTLLGVKPLPTRKRDLVMLLEEHLKGESLRLLWEQLEPLQQMAVSETVYSSDGIFNVARFHAKYGDLPEFEISDGSRRYNKKPTNLRLFIYPGSRIGLTWVSIIPEDLKQSLQSFIPQPEVSSLKSIGVLPETLTLVQEDRERAAQIDLPVLLRLVDSGKVAVSNKTFQPSLSTMTLLIKHISNGDFYELKPKVNKWEQSIGPIKAFAWPILIQAGKLVELSGSKLSLTKAGRKALSQSSPESLQLIWKRWLKTKLLDEFSRINDIKGQQSKGKHMTAIVQRREAAIEALSQCPVGRWVEVNELWRFMQATGYDFEVTRDPWKLYIEDRQYGSLGYDGFHNWTVLQGRYVLCLLFEYVATLGFIDVAYNKPEGARQDYNHIWGTDDLEFLSRYDGLQFIRLNSLGAFCLGLTDKYVPEKPQTQTSISVLPSLQINIINNTLSADERLLMENYAESKSDTVWLLDKKKALLAVENGHSISELRDFLEDRDDQPLPESVESFLTTIQYKGQALRQQGAALLIECRDKKVAELIAGNTHTKSLCQRVGNRSLVVRSDVENKFRKAVNDLGYGMPKV